MFRDLIKSHRAPWRMAELGPGGDRFSAERHAAYVHDRAMAARTGIVMGTRVATSIGWQTVESIAVGEAVLTFDNGLQPVKAIERQRLWSGHGDLPEEHCPLYVPAGAIGNREAALLLPGQGVMVESDVAEAEIGDPFVLVEAAALEGVCGIERRLPEGAIDTYRMLFEDEQIVFASNGALCACDAAGAMLGRMFDLGAVTGAASYRMLNDDTAPDLLDRISWELEERLARTLSGSPEA